MFESGREELRLVAEIICIRLKILFWMYPRYVFALVCLWLVENGVWL